ncbi:MAG: hypothetical protein MK052_09175 [Alphaproteobacteria bacterium]|nr:hypothetical protein [Alphaproteobacteria bacterium]
MDMASLSPRKNFTRRQMLGLAVSGSLMLACAGITSPAAAADKFINKCHAPTPATSSSSYPGVSKIILSNNLARPAGKAVNAPGQLLYIEGRITDENCIPVSNAIVDIWQTNPFGKYRWAVRDELLTPEPVFAGNGRAVTDNLGRYQFLTLFPGGYGRNAPHVHMRINHPDYKSLDTTMYFRGDRRNADDPRFQAFKPASQALLLSNIKVREGENPEGDLKTRFDIVLKGGSDFRSY